MPWRLIVILIILVLVALFSGFNHTPVSISVGFHVFEKVPLFLALIIAFILGALIMVPFTIRSLNKRRKVREMKSEAKIASKEGEGEERGAES